MKWKEATRSFKREVLVFRLVLKDPRTPRHAKWLMGLAVGYSVMPFDLIPDFIRILGFIGARSPKPPSFTGATLL